MEAMPLRVLVGVWLALLGLLALTLGASDWLAGGLVVAMLIALVKAVLVLLYFMHLRHDRWLYALVFLLGLVFLGLLLMSVLRDAQEYHPLMYGGDW